MTLSTQSHPSEARVIGQAIIDAIGALSLGGGGTSDATAALQTAGNASLVSILAAVDQLEGYVDQLEGYVDTLEASFTTLNGKDFATQTSLAALLALAQPLPSIQVGATLSRPSGTPTYGTNTLVANHATAGSVVLPTIVLAAPRRVVGAKLITNHTTGLAGKSFQCALWTAAPTFSNGDTGAYAVATNGDKKKSSFMFLMEQFVTYATGLAAPFERPVVVLPAGTYSYDVQSLDGFVAQASKDFILELEYD